MDLILWRHAEAEEAVAGADDLARALTPKGERQAEHIARWLARQLPEAIRLLASPARRAQQTAAALGRHQRRHCGIETVATLAPGGTVADLLAAAHWPEAPGAVLVVGHQPTLGMTAATLLAGDAQPWPVRKAGIWWLRGRERGGVLQVVLHAVLAPDQL